MKEEDGDKLLLLNNFFSFLELFFLNFLIGNCCFQPHVLFRLCYCQPIFYEQDIQPKVSPPQPAPQPDNRITQPHELGIQQQRPDVSSVPQTGKDSLG